MIAENACQNADSDGQQGTKEADQPGHQALPIRYHPKSREKGKE